MVGFVSMRWQIRRSVRTPILMALLLGLGTQAIAVESIDVAALGPQVGERVPDFSLPDQNGRLWTRNSILGPNGAILLFHRSADW